MGRKTPFCEKKVMKRGQWTHEEDEILINFISQNGQSSWSSIPHLAGLNRCGKSCRLRWTNYLRPNIKRGPFNPEEEKLVIQLHAVVGNRWAAIPTHLSGRTDNEIKNLWNTHLRKRLISEGIDPQTHEPLLKKPPHSPSTRHMAQWESARLEAKARLSRESFLLSHKNYSESDYFLRIWNSEIGEIFRSFKSTNVMMPVKPDSASSESLVSQASSCTKNLADKNVQNKNEFEFTPTKDEDSSESAMELLMDFPFGWNEINFMDDNYII